MLNLPDIRQRRGWTCGRAASECVLQYLGKQADLRQLLTTPMDGTDPRNIEGLLRKAGCKVLSGEMTVDDLRYQTKHGRPVVAAVKNHYVVVGGVGRGKVRYHDPLFGPCKVSVADFVVWWNEADRLGVEYRQFGIAASG